MVQRLRIDCLARIGRKPPRIDGIFLTLFEVSCRKPSQSYYLIGLTRMHSDETSPSTTFSVLGIFSALIVGIPLWLIFFAFLNGNPIGKTDGKDALLAFAPIIGFSIPFAISKFGHSPGVSSWILAIAPLLSVVNFAACVAVSVNSSSRDVMPLAFSLVWAIPFLAIVYSSFKKQ